MPVLTDATASTLLATTALPTVLTDVASSALLAIVALPPVLANVVASTLLALTALPPVLALGPLLARWLHLLQWGPRPGPHTDLLHFARGGLHQT